MLVFNASEMVLECAKDLRFCDSHAEVTIFGKRDTIRNHFQLAKRFDSDEEPIDVQYAMENEPTHLCINRWNMSTKFMEAYYDILWVYYFDQNPELIKVARMYENFTDDTCGKKRINQATSIERYVKFGKKHILEKHKDFLKMVNAYIKYTI